MKIGEKSSESKSVKSSRIAEIDKIKGLKEFMGKNLKWLDCEIIKINSKY